MFVVKNAGAFRSNLAASPNFCGANNSLSAIRHPSSAAPQPSVYSNILENDRMSSALVEMLKAEIMQPRNARIDTKRGSAGHCPVPGLALPIQTLWQASLPTRLFLNCSLAPRLPLLLPSTLDAGPSTLIPLKFTPTFLRMTECLWTSDFVGRYPCPYEN
jgi:hypothetical protein